MQVRGQKDPRAVADETPDWNGERRREEAREKERLDANGEQSPDEELGPDEDLESDGTPLPPDPCYFPTPLSYSAQTLAVPRLSHMSPIPASSCARPTRPPSNNLPFPSNLHRTGGHAI